MGRPPRRPAPPARRPALTAPRPTLTALQVDVPEADHVLDAVDRARLPGVRLLRPAHISLTYPWLPPDEALARIPALERAVAGWEPFGLSLGALRAFPTRRGRTVLYLEPSRADHLRALADALVGPDVDFAPHLSVARLTDEEAGPYAREEIEARVAPLLPVDATVRTLSVHVQYDARWWRVEHVAHLAAPPWAVRSG